MKKKLFIIFLLVILFLVACTIILFQKNSNISPPAVKTIAPSEGVTPTLFFLNPNNANSGYITIVIGPSIEILVIDPQKRKTGTLIQNGQTQEYQEIPEASYGFEGPISNTNSEGKMEALGTGVNSFLLSKPQDGDYTILFSSKEDTYWETNIVWDNGDGDGSFIKEKIVTNPTSTQKFILHYLENGHSTISKQ